MNVQEAGQDSTHQTTRPLETRQEYLRQEREQWHHECKEYEINKQYNEEMKWLFEQARLHHMDEQERSQLETRQVAASNNTEQHALQDLRTEPMLTPVNNGSMSIANRDLSTEELQLLHLGRPQEEIDEEDQVETLLGLQEPDMEARLEAMEEDTGGLDNMPSEPAELVGLKDGEARDAQGPGEVNPLEDGFKSSHEQVDNVPMPDSRHDTSVSETQTCQPECHDIGGQVVPEADLQVSEPENLEFPRPDCVPICGDVPGANGGHQLGPEEMPTGSMFYNTRAPSQGVVTTPSNPRDQTIAIEDSSALHLHSEQPDREERRGEPDIDEGQYHLEVAGVSEGNVREESPQTGFADIGCQEIPHGVDETQCGITSLAAMNLELAVTSNLTLTSLTPELQAWVSSQVDNARERTRHTVCPHFYFIFHHRLLY